MAKLGAPLMVSDIRGKLAGNVYSRVPAGGTLRVRVRPHNPRTTAQTLIRTALTEASRIVHDMSAADYAEWVAYVKTITKKGRISGSSYTSSVIATVNALAVKYSQVNAFSLSGFPATPPATAYPGDIITVSGATGGASGEIDFTATAANDVATTTLVLVQLLRSENAKPQPNAYRMGKAKVFAAMDLSVTVDGLNPGAWYSLAYQFVATDTGQSTLPIVIGTFSAHA